MKSKLPYPKGFTLIELLVTIAIIAFLAGIVMIAYPAALKRGRDTKRRSDIKQYQALLEVFAGANNDQYPSTPVNFRPDSLCPVIGPTPCPKDPSSTTYEYQYRSNGSGAANDATIYVLWAYQEYTANYFVVCSNGRGGIRATAPFSATCPL